MCEVPEKWLKNLNEEFRKNDVPHKQRPWLAWTEWSKHIGVSTTLGDEAVKEIFAWFSANAEAGAQNMEPMYIGAYYYDACFWPVSIPVVYGERMLRAEDALKTIPQSIKTRLLSDKEEMQQFVLLWADCIDYGFGSSALINEKWEGNFWQELLRSSDQQLTGTITLLLERSLPNPKAIETARMAVEMFLKAFIAFKVGLTEKEAIAIGHNLNKGLDRCLEIDARSELAAIRSELKCYPDIADRYKGLDKAPRELWHGYSVAQFAGATVIRALSGRDVRRSMANGIAH